MEPTLVTPQKHFVNRVTPFSKTLALALFIALPVLMLYVGYLFGSRETTVTPALSMPATQTVTQDQTPPENSKPYVNEKFGFTAQIPDDWTVNVVDHPYASGTITYITSPDYEEEKRLIAGDGYSEEMTVSQGARFIFDLEHANGVNESIQAPDAYVEFYLRGRSRCSNCFNATKIMLGGQSATKGSSELLGEFPAGTEVVTEAVSTVREGKEFSFRFAHLKTADQYEPVLADFIRTFKFTR